MEQKKRIITGSLGLVGLLFWLAYTGKPGILLFAFFLSSMALYELVKIGFVQKNRSQKMFFVLGGHCILSSFFVFPAYIISHEHAVLIWVMCFFSWAVKEAQKTQNLLLAFSEFLLGSFGILYLHSIPWLLVSLYELPYGLEWLFFFLLIVFASDTAAYFVGKKYGTVKIAPLISPKKSKQGAIAGVVSCILASVFLKYFFLFDLPWWSVALSPFVGIVSQLGDLSESLLKRALSVKDSGSFLPGHGGVLDRFDGVIFSLPFMLIALKCILYFL